MYKENKKAVSLDLYPQLKPTCVHTCFLCTLSLYGIYASYAITTARLDFFRAHQVSRTDSCAHIQVPYTCSVCVCAYTHTQHIHIKPL